jgi:hypothetical protein
MKSQHHEGEIAGRGSLMASASVPNQTDVFADAIPFYQPCPSA